MKCSHCGQKIKADKPSITVNVAPEHAHLAPAGKFHISGDNCFEKASKAHCAVQSLHDDAETVLGSE